MKYFLVAFLLGLSLSVTGQSNVNIIPLPQEIELRNGWFQMDAALNVYIDANFNGLSFDYIKDQCQKYLDLEVNETRKKRADILLLLEPENNEVIGSYQLDISNEICTIQANSDQGLFNGFQSLLQLVIQNAELKKIPCCSVKDEPRYTWRGLMVDESRHFFGKDKMKEVIDLMALLKLNVFHWHLTDEPAWRLEIKQYPKLTSVGGQGTWSDPNAPVQYYTQEDIKEIVAYATERFIEVVPEIDMPGHASAANLAYPEFSGGGNEKHPHFTFNPGKEETYQYLTNILREVVTLFPSKYIHIGGDEVHFANEQWNDLPDVKKLMKRENLENLVDVEHYFLNRMADSIKTLDKQIMGWDEVTNAGLSNKESLVMWWRHDKVEVLDQLLAKEYQTILCPRIPLYMDFDQHESHQWGRRWGGFCDLEKVYSFPDNLKTDISSSSVIGMQANLWSERVPSVERFDFMIWPRLVAMSEAAWTSKSQKDYSSFQERMKWFLLYLDSLGINYFNPLHPEQTPEPEGVRSPSWQKKFKTVK
jgi:hexosaminidase